MRLRSLGFRDEYPDLWGKNRLVLTVGSEGESVVWRLLAEYSLVRLGSQIARAR